MITIYPLKYIELQKYYRSLTFTLNELSLLLNVKGFYKGKKIDKNIAISKNHLYTSKTVLNNSLTLFYTYVLTDLNNFTYISSNITFNSMDPDKPEFLLYLDEDYNCINNSITIISNTFINVSNTVTLSLTSLYSLTSNFSNSAITSLTSLFSLTAAYCINSSNNTNLFDIPYTRIFVDTAFPTNVSENDSFYNINTKKLYVYRFNTWIEINWQNYIKCDKIYKEGYLRINPNTGGLEITPQVTWYEIIPTIGTVFTPMNYNYVYYIAPGQTYVGYSSSIAPIIISSGDFADATFFEGTYYLTYSKTGYFGLYPFSTTLNNDYGSYIIGGSTSITSISFNNKNYGVISYHSSTDVKVGHFYIYIWFNKGFIDIYTSVINNTNTNILTLTSHGYYVNKDMYYLGTWCFEGIPISVDKVILKRKF
jgi:hypothetical protein